MKLVNLIPLKEIDFRNQNAFDAYNKQHKLRPDTKVTIAGKPTTAGKAAQSSEPVKGTSVFGGDDSSSKITQTDKFNMDVDSVVYNKRTNTVGIVRLGDERGETKTDADGNVNTDELEPYNPMKYPHQKDAQVAPSTSKEIDSRGLWKPFSKTAIENIADLTDNNDHNGAVMVLAKMMGDKSSTAEMEKIQKYQNLKGHMPQSLIKYRSSILNNLLVQAKKKYGDKFAKQLQNSF